MAYSSRFHVLYYFFVSKVAYFKSCFLKYISHFTFVSGTLCGLGQPVSLTVIIVNVIIVH